MNTNRFKNNEEPALSAEELNDMLKDIDNSKVDKEEGKGLSEANYTPAEQKKLKGIAEGAEKNVIVSLTIDGKQIQLKERTAEIKDPEVKNARGNYGSLSERFNVIEARVSSESDNRGHVYVSRYKLKNNSSSALERMMDSIGLVANATKNGSTVVNDFDSKYPFNQIISCNIDLATGKILAYYGDPNYKTDGSNGDVFTYYPKTWIKITQDEDYLYIYLSDVERSGFTEYPAFYIGRYTGAIVDGKLRTYAGLSPEWISLDKTRTLAKTYGDKVQVMDYRYYIICVLYLIEYADFNSQKMLGNGIIQNRDAVSLLAEKNTNRVVVSDVKQLEVGNDVNIGTQWWNNSIASKRKITAINDYSDNGTTGKSIVFDGAPVDIEVGSHIWGIAQPGGQCDSLGMKSGCLINDGYHSMIYRGVENILGNILQWIDGVLLQDDKIYVCDKPEQYNSTDYSKYEELSYSAYHGSGYVTTTGYDRNKPLFRYPTAVGGGDSTYMCDNMWNQGDNQIHAPFVGGNFNNWADAGLFYVNLNNHPSDSNFLHRLSTSY